MTRYWHSESHRLSWCAVTGVKIRQPEQSNLDFIQAHTHFFDKVRDLTSTAFWTTDEGMADLGFVGNRPMASFEGPPPEVLRRLGLD